MTSRRSTSSLMRSVISPDDTESPPHARMNDVSSEQEAIREHSGRRVLRRAIVAASIGLILAVGAIFLLVPHLGPETLYSERANLRAEVIGVFGEFTVSQDRKMLEGGGYLSSSTTNTESDSWPVESATSSEKVNLLPLPPEWKALGVRLHLDKVHCSYTSVTGKGGDHTSIGAIAAGEFGYTAPTEDWYYLLARCDMDDDQSVDSYFFQSSDDSEFRAINEGH